MDLRHGPYNFPVSVVIAAGFTHREEGRERTYFQSLLSISHLLDMQLTLVHLVLTDIL